MTTVPAREAAIHLTVQGVADEEIRNERATRAEEEIQNERPPRAEEEIQNERPPRAEEEIQNLRATRAEESQNERAMTEKEIGNERATRARGIKKREAEALYAAILKQDIGGVESVLSKMMVTLRDSITINGNTALHVAVGTTRDTDFLQKMFNLATQSNQQPLDMVNSEGSTLLHVAAIVGNTEAVRMLVEINPDLLYVLDNENQTPLASAFFNMHKDTYMYLLRLTNFQYMDIEAGTNAGCELLVNVISSRDYSSAMAFFDAIREHNMSPTDIDTVLMAVVQNFPSKINSWELMFAGWSTCSFTFLGYHFALRHKFLFVDAIIRKNKNFHCAKNLLDGLCSFIDSKIDSGSHIDCYYNAILEAAKQNADEAVKRIVSRFPNAIWSTNEDGHNIIQYAVINRSENVYNLLYQMSEHKNLYRTIRDRSKNNLLHLAAKLAPPDKLDHIVGAALQMQRELQWFKEVEKFVSPLNIFQKNSFGETPQMLFTKEHKELLLEGEKWMKGTAESYTITSTLITTIVFAAAITVPGGNKQDIGTPVFTNKLAFKVFAVSDAISLFTSVTSLLMFLSIISARFAEQDFLFKLPTKLIIGLATLFVSTTSMLVALGATIFLVFGENNPHILVPIAGLICLPITSFMTLQLPLIYDLMNATYGRSMFGKKSAVPFY